jgi:hypothetical protein
MRVKALQKIYYNRRDILPGETYDMDDREHGEAKILATLGKIEIVEEEKPQAQAPLAPTRALAAEEPAREETPPQTSGPVGPMTTDSGLVPGARRNMYRRRDLKAEK